MSVGYSSIELLGYLGQDPEKIEAQGATGARFSLAVNRAWRNGAGERQEDTGWFRVIAWNQVAENCLQYLSKGRLVLVVGRPRVRQWKDQDGGKHEQIQVQAERVIFLDSPEPEEPS